MVISDVQSSSDKVMPCDSRGKFNGADQYPLAKRTRSVDLTPIENNDLIARLISTLDGSKSGFKPNIRGQCVHSPFSTLSQILERLDPLLYLDIEISKNSHARR